MNETLEIAVAACLHDIGKLLQRADFELTDSARRMEQMLCPTNEVGYGTHRHVLWTNDFIERFTHWLPPSLNRARLNHLASAHHRPSSPPEWIIAEADRLASGHDRRPAEQESEEGYLHVPLYSIFAALALKDGMTGPAPWYPPDHDLTASVVPQSVRAVPLLRPKYKVVADELVRQIGAWDRVPEPLLCEAVMSLTARHFAMTPASTIDEPDVSLHDHMRLVAAFAAAIHRYHTRRGSFDEGPIRDRSVVKFRLLSGDLSGIQAFIFAPAPEGMSKGIARIFRARSFYLSMLTHVATLELLAAAGLPGFNRVIDAGGRFVLLVDSTDETLEALRSTGRRLQRWLVENHHGLLTLNIDDALTASGEEFIGSCFETLYRRIQAGAEAAKSRRLAAWLLDGGRWAEDAQCLRQFNYRQSQEAAFERDKEIGKHLPDARFVAVFGPGAGCPGLLGEDRPVRLFEHRLQLLTSADPALQADGLSDLFALEDADPAGAESWIPRRPLANYVPRLTDGDVKHLNLLMPERDETEDDHQRCERGKLATFQHLAYCARRPAGDGAARGAALIAVLKADVDRLGLLFARGLGDKTSFGRISTLSRMLDAFFKSFLPARFREPESPYRHVYTVFAGGDDLLLVGPWHVMMDLTADLHKWFRTLACDNPDMTLSAGIVFGRPKAPVNSLGRLAEEQLDRAKNAGRNRIAVLNRLLTWDEYHSALADGKRLFALASAQDGRRPLLNNAFLYGLLQASRQAEEIALAAQQNRAVPLAAVTWRSHLAYDFRRNVLDRIDRDRSLSISTEDRTWLEQLMGLSARRDPGHERILRVAATYALYMNRGGAA